MYRLICPAEKLHEGLVHSCNGSLHHKGDHRSAEGLTWATNPEGTHARRPVRV